MNIAIVEEKNKDPKHNTIIPMALVNLSKTLKEEI